MTVIGWVANMGDIRSGKYVIEWVIGGVKYDVANIWIVSVG